MISIKRKRKDGERFIQPQTDWFKSARKLKKKAIKDGAKHEVDDHFKHTEVRKALEKLFHDKCAYCETSIAAGADWNVEHYRPNGRVAEREDHPGYYWLAYTWDNLFPSCEHCNQNRKDKPRWGDATVGVAQGKLDQFPVHDESDRALRPQDDLKAELPYLLNPCEDYPERHLTYDIQGQIQPINEDDIRATETIRICHLTRRRLRDRRILTLVRVKKILKVLNKAAGGNDKVNEGLEQMLRDAVTDRADYTGIARAVKEDPVAFGVPPP